MIIDMTGRKYGLTVEIGKVYGLTKKNLGG